LTEQQDKINSLIGRIKNASKGTQFQYNKAGNEYTDQEVLERLEKHQKRIAIAVEASYGDGIINKEEAALIMTGNLSGYQGAKDNAIDQIETEIKRLNRLEESISKQISKHVGKRGFNFSSIDMEGIVSDVNTELGSDFTAPDINTLLEDLSERQSIVYDEKVKLKRSYRGWQGKEYLQAPKVSESDKKKYEESILGDGGGDDGGGDDGGGDGTKKKKGEITITPFVEGEESTVDLFNKKVKIKDEWKKPSKTGLPRIGVHASSTLKGAKREFLFINTDTGKWEEWDGDTAKMDGQDVPVMVDSKGKKRFYDYINKKWK